MQYQYKGRLQTTVWLELQQRRFVVAARKMRVFENRVLSRTLAPKRWEVTEDRRKLQNEELHNFYSRN
jgi:hypothetical protein